MRIQCLKIIVKVAKPVCSKTYLFLFHATGMPKNTEYKIEVLFDLKSVNNLFVIELICCQIYFFIAVQTIKNLLFPKQKPPNVTLLYRLRDKTRFDHKNLDVVKYSATVKTQRCLLKYFLKSFRPKWWLTKSRSRINYGRMSAIEKMSVVRNK